jgi:catechol 2,3-dioxygenase-like lactoylglutathione lyase family enzyme
MTIPQRLTMVTIGARSVPKLREFYRAIGLELVDDDEIERHSRIDA